jgi:hypothetical protein
MPLLNLRAPRRPRRLLYQKNDLRSRRIAYLLVGPHVRLLAADSVKFAFAIPVTDQLPSEWQRLIIYEFETNNPCKILCEIVSA